MLLTGSAELCEARLDVVEASFEQFRSQTERVRAAEAAIDECVSRRRSDCIVERMKKRSEQRALDVQLEDLQRTILTAKQACTPSGK